VKLRASIARLLAKAGLVSSLNYQLLIALLLCSAFAGFYVEESVFNLYQDTHQEIAKEKASYRTNVAMMLMEDLAEQYEGYARGAATVLDTSSGDSTIRKKFLQSLLKQTRASFIAIVNPDSITSVAVSQYRDPRLNIPLILRNTGMIFWGLPGSKEMKEEMGKYTNSPYFSAQNFLSEVHYLPGKVEPNCNFSSLKTLAESDTARGWDLMPEELMSCLGLLPQLGSKDKSVSSQSAGLTLLISTKAGNQKLVIGLLINNMQELPAFLQRYLAVSRSTFFVSGLPILTNLPDENGQPLLQRDLLQTVQQEVEQKGHFYFRIEHLELAGEVYREYYFPLKRKIRASDDSETVAVFAGAGGNVVNRELNRLHIELWWMVSKLVLALVFASICLNWLLSRKEAELVLKRLEAEQSNQQRNALLASSDEGILGLDQQGLIVFANRRAHELLGTNKLEGSHVGMHLGIENCEKLMSDLYSYNFGRMRATIMRPDQPMLTCECASFELEDSATGLRYGLSVRDITERLALEQKRKEAAVLAERTRMTAEIHDNMLAYLNGALLQLRFGMESVSEDIEQAFLHMSEAEKECRRCINQARELISFSHPDTLRPIQQLLESIRRCLDRAALVGFQVTFKESIALENIPGNLYRDIDSIASEAIENARRHSGGSQITVSLTAERRHLLLSISDNGQGFDPDSLPVKHAEDGFGLISMQRRAGRMGADLVISSLPGMGCTVSLKVALEALL
jgi:PAS domain S-box-containing protein